MPAARTSDWNLRRWVVVVAVGLGVALSATGTARAHDLQTVAGHAAQDDVIHTPAQEQALGLDSRRDTAADAAAAAAAVDGPAVQTGTWGPVTDWPVVGVHVALLPNGKVLAYDSVGDHATESYPNSEQVRSRATVWDPATNTQTPVNVETGYNVFCSGLAHLVDGSIFLAGGNKNTALNGIRATHIFNPETNTWSVGQDMQADRWYPTVTTLSDGRMLITSGGNGGVGNANIPEVRETDGAVTQLTGAELALPLYPWMEVAPDGRVVNLGPWTGIQSLRVSGHAGTWRYEVGRGDFDRNYGSHALYDIGKALVAGGGVAGSAAGSSQSARIVDVTGSTATVASTGDMAYKRRQNNLTILADGSVLATGGNSSGVSLVDKANGVYAAERWDPATGSWTTLAAESRTRQYHSTALLLPDGRVLSAGGGICGTCDDVGYLEKNAQVFTPPYLYDADGSLATRPVIRAAPRAVPYGGDMSLLAAGPAAIRKVGLIRLGAVTHGDNMDQRYVPLSFSTGSGTSLTATAPANANVAPPGVYMLAVVDSRGVPSVARMIQIGTSAAPDAGPVTNLTQTTDSSVAPATVRLTASASDEDGVAQVEFFRDGVSLGIDDSAPYTATASGLPAGSYSFTAVATDTLGTSTTSSSVGVQVRAPNVAPTVSATVAGGPFTAPANVEVRASAQDGDGSVQKVELLRDGVVFATRSAAPYVATAGDLPAGSYAFTARATDDAGAVTTSAPATVVVGAPKPVAKPPTVTLTRPTAGTSLVAPATVQLGADAADPDDLGTVTQVEFFVGSRSLGVDTDAPYTATAGDLPAGTYVFTARATDDLGASTTSAPVRVVVAAPPPLDLPPLVELPPTNPPPVPVPVPAPRLTSVAVVGATPATRQVRVTSTGAVDVAVTLERVRGSRRTALRGTRRARVPAGTSTVSLREPWSGARLVAGRYRVAVRAGTRTMHAYFTIAGPR